MLSALFCEGVPVRIPVCEGIGREAGITGALRRSLGSPPLTHAGISSVSNFLSRVTFVLLVFAVMPSPGNLPDCLVNSVWPPAVRSDLSDR